MARKTNRTGSTPVYAVRIESGTAILEPMTLAEVPAGVTVWNDRRAKSARRSAERYGDQLVQPTGPAHLGLFPFALTLPEDPVDRRRVLSRGRSRTAVYADFRRMARNQAKVMAAAADLGLEF